MSVKMSVNNVMMMFVDHYRGIKTFQEVKFNDDYSITKKGLLFQLDIRTDERTKGDVVYHIRSFMVAFCGNVSVFVREVDRAGGVLPCIGENADYSGWINTSNHDSCWRTDGLRFIDETFFNMCEEIYPDKRPFDCHIYAEFGISNAYPKIVDITLVNDPDHTYGYKVKNIVLTKNKECA